MNIGDRVRTKHGSDEGIIVKLVNKQIVEIEIEDGFTIPVAKSDLVIVAKEERSAFKEKPKEAETPKAPAQKKVLSTQGLFLAIVPEGEHLLKLHLINNSDLHLFQHFGTTRHGKFTHESASSVGPKSYISLCELRLTQQDKWPSLHLEIIRHHEAMEERLTPLMADFPPKASRLLNGQKNIPLLNVTGHLHQLDETESSWDTSGLAEALMSPKEEDLPKRKMRSTKLRGQEPEVDLHLEELVDEPGSVPEDERLTLQLRAFQNALDNAIAQGLKGITFIHGVGAGVLRKEIHRQLSKNPPHSIF